MKKNISYEQLSQCSLFHGIPADKIESILEDIRYSIKEFPRGETVFQLFDEAGQIVLVLDGKVCMQKIFPGGNTLPVSIGERGTLLGQAAVFSSQKMYPCELVTLEPSVLMFFDRRNILKLLHADDRILEHFISTLSSAAFHLQTRIELLSYSGIQQKAAFYLLSASARRNSRSVPVPGSITNWANDMNVSRTSLHRELGKMEKAGLIQIEKSSITILEEEQLWKILE